MRWKGEMASVTLCVCVCVCVLAVIEKPLELLTPNLELIHSMAGSRHALTLGSKGHTRLRKPPEWTVTSAWGCPCCGGVLLLLHETARRI